MGDRDPLGRPRHPLGPYARGVSFRCELRVRYHECDPQGIVFNANWFVYFDIAITELWRAALGSYAGLAEHGCDIVVVEAQATFRAPARFDELIALELDVTRIGETSMTTEIAVARDADALVSGRLVHVFVDPADLSKRAIPPPVRSALEHLGRS
jgi:acyl-CoA thioester hydrolase